MIRLAFFILVFGLAMLLGPILANHPGYVMLVVAGVTIEATFIGLMLVLFGTILACWLLWWVLKRLFHLPRLSFSFLRSRKERRARQAMQHALLSFARQDWQQADQYFDLAKADSDWDKIKQIMACYAAQRAGDSQKANQKAAQLDSDDNDSAVVVADLLLQQGDAAKAVAYLAPRIEQNQKDGALGRLWLAALLQAGQWQTLLEQVPVAIKQQWLNKAQWQQYRYQLYPAAVAGLAQAGQFDENLPYWSNLPAKERKSVAAILGKARAKAVSGDAEQAEKLLLDSLALADVPLAYAAIRQIPLGRSVLALRKQVQHWLRDHNNNGYLYALLSYCAEQEGEQDQARHAWEKALQYQPELANAAAFAK
ncbi:heme biosynthesis HemY N-terminal domain-containing protein [Rheinheimera sp. 4Y26]|uniref:heme biosynthesis HemY N-terminal domain-containing protein n=1 Tax=Rheinheimera sp. 4Y26 TaxID=2977811 RepID=UPI0021B0F52B|nr:heme biosynthesis HemY N-terminal domain-containing protein [Rheinheimera sp. 4Y26]MCT6698265.1 heme biosynthesis protein HemY [Rheinheimera sp. 4Y26]